YKIQVNFPTEDDLMQILDRTTGTHHTDVKPVVNGERLLEMRALVRAMPVTESLTRYVVRVLRATHPDDARAPELVKRYVRFGGSPRGAQSILLAARIRASLHGRSPSTDDVKAVALPALRHRVILNFEGEAEGISIDDCIGQVLEGVPKD
ncbi:MAG: AAA family ATPase, partial [Nannocystales bacterium]